jgi:hypothetical protein
LQQSAYNPASDNAFTGQAVEGNKIQFSFQDFTITGSDVSPDAQMGFRSTAALGGSYLVSVNYAANKPKHPNYFIRIEGKNEPCTTSANVVMIDDNGDPVTTDTPFPIDLCATER